MTGVSIPVEDSKCAQGNPSSDILTQYVKVLGCGWNRFEHCREGGICGINEGVGLAPHMATCPSPYSPEEGSNVSQNLKL